MKQRSLKGLMLLLLVSVFGGNSLFAQSVTVTGTITDSDGLPMVGVGVMVKDEVRGVISGLDGTYSINVTPAHTLQFSLLGYETQEILVGNQKVIDVVLLPKTDNLDEVTVVAFAKQKKESVIASVSSITPSSLRVPSSNLTTALAGKVSGIISYQVSGEPGQDNAQFFVRGISSFGASAKKDPLILIDNIEMSSSDLARLTTDDIASFSVMKDATAAVSRP